MQSVSPAPRVNLTPTQSLPINHLTVPHESDALQVLQEKWLGGRPADTRKLSSRALDIEPIGHVTATPDHETKNPLSELRKLATKHETELHTLFNKHTRISPLSFRLPPSSEKLHHC